MDVLLQIVNTVKTYLPLILSLPLSPPSFPDTCTALGLRISDLLPNTTVHSTTYIPADTTITFTDPCGTPPVTTGVDMCRVRLGVPTSDASGIEMEAWLPREWTGRFLGTGNGGLGGCIQYPDLQYGASLGFATVGANNGHDGNHGLAFLNNPEVIADFAYRSMHTNVVVGKAITQLFYSKPHTKSYYIGCSTGGRQGLKSIQDFPDDFDGVVAGAPAAPFTRLISWSGQFYVYSGGEDSASFVPPQMWQVIQKDIFALCDALDGVVDGILEDPARCDYDPSRLECRTLGQRECLSRAQVQAVRDIFTPLYDLQGQLMYPAPTLSSAGHGGPMIYALGKAYHYTSDWFKYVVYNNASLDTRMLSRPDWARAYAQNPFNIETWSGNLTRFRDRGGKVLTYHGNADAVISAFGSEWYYEHVLATMGEPLDPFYRFFRVPGMRHCGYGEGAWMIGQAGGGAEGNVLMDVVRWVEDGLPPETITGVKYVQDRVENGVERVRKHCRYPKKNVYTGGDAGKAESWQCV